MEISRRAIGKVGWMIEEEALQLIGEYATNGREAVNITQLAVGLAQTANEMLVTASAVEKVLNNCNLTPRPRFKAKDYPPGRDREWLGAYR